MPALPEDVVVVTAADRASGTQVAAAARRTSLRLVSDVTLDLGENLRVRGSGIDARLGGSISLRGTLPDAPGDTARSASAMAATARTARSCRSPAA